MSGREEMFSRKARDRLSGALTSAVEGTDILDGLPDLTAGLDSPLRRIVNSGSPWNSPTKSPRQVRRRRKKEQAHDTAFHHTFVMKLFDRSVDLAQFAENASLYPVCRAWMKNQPHNTSFAPRLRTPTPEPPEPEKEGNSEDATEGEGKEEKKEGDGEEAATAVENKALSEENGSGSLPKPVFKEPEKPKAIYKMPAFEPLGVDRDVSARVPKGLTKRKCPEELEIDESKESASDLLKSHVSEWKKVRKMWRVAAFDNESRFKDSMKILEDMFET